MPTEHVYVQATSPVGHPTFSRAGRHWPTQKPIPVEVLDQDEDPPLVTPEGGGSPVPDPARIGRNTLKVLQADDRISVRQDAGTQTALSSAALAASRDAATKAGARTAALEHDLAVAKAESDAAKAEVGRLERENQQLRQQLSDAKAGSGKEAEQLRARVTELEGQIKAEADRKAAEEARIAGQQPAALRKEQEHGQGGRKPR